MRMVITAVTSLVLGCGTSGPPEVGSEIAGCDGAKLMASPQDPRERGVWAVGAKTVTIDGLRTEVWYPVRAADVEGASKAQYDFRLLLPPDEVSKIPDDDNPWLPCDCVRDAPLDDQHGPYPIVVFVHDTGGYRYQSLSIVTHWASHGFVVIAADHPGLYLGDRVASACGGPTVQQSVSADIDRVLAALTQPTGELAFLAGHVEPTRVAIAGHGVGANEAAAADTKAGVRAVVSMLGDRPVDATNVEAAMFFSSSNSTPLPAWNASISPSWSIGIIELGHDQFTHECSTLDANRTFQEVAAEHGVCDQQIGGGWGRCGIVGPTPQLVWSAVSDLGSLLLRSTLQCQDLESSLHPSEVRVRHGVDVVVYSPEHQ